MKKIIYIVLTIAFPCKDYAQTNFNELSVAEHKNVSFNNVSILQLLDFNGNEVDLSNMFGLNFTDDTHPQDDEEKFYDSSQMSITYVGDELGGIEVKTAGVTITIAGTTFSIGDDISVLGYGSLGFNSFISPSDSSLGIAIFKPDYYDTDVYVFFDVISGIIQEVGYMNPT